MPLLMCPNDDAPMQTLERSGVSFDMCPTCRGVWLDRGELEKLMALAADDGRAAAPAPRDPPRDPPRPWGGQPPRDDHRRDDGYRRKKRESLFDIFD